MHLLFNLGKIYAKPVNVY